MAVAVNAQTTVNYVFADQGFVNAEVITGGTIDSNLSYTVQQNTAGNSVTYYTSGTAARVYSDRNSADGNSITITPATGVVITSLTINALAGYTPTVTYSVDGGAFQTATLSGTTYTITGISAESSLVFKNAHSGGSTNIQLRIPSFTVTYDAASLSVTDINSSSKSLVKNTQVENSLIFAAKANVKVYNVNGQMVKSAAVNENTSLDVSSLPRGMYIVTGEVDGKAVSQKVLKK